MSTPDSDPRVVAAWDRAAQARDLADRLLAINNYDLSSDEGWAAYNADHDADVAGERYQEIWHEVNAELHPDLYADQPDPEAEP
jgi:hypothetical protein